MEILENVLLVVGLMVFMWCVTGSVEWVWRLFLDRVLLRMARKEKHTDREG